MLKTYSPIVIIVALAIWFAEFSRAHDSFGDPFPPMGPLIEIYFKHGRSISMALLISIVVFGLYSSTKLTKNRNSPNANPIFLINLVIILKLGAYGNTDIFLLGIIALATQYYVFSIYMPRSGANRKTPKNHHLVATENIVSILFLVFTLSVIVNFYVFIQFPEGAINYSIRLHGVMANPQHLAVLFSLSVPAAFHKLLFQTNSLVFKFLLFSLILVGIFLVFTTASRTGLLSVSITVFIYLYLTVRKEVSVLLLLTLVPCIVIVFSSSSLLVSFFQKTATSRGDTRSTNWLAAWNDFLEYPFLGKPPHESVGRIFFAENFWLAAISAGGLTVLLIAIFALYRILKIAILSWAQIRISHINIFVFTSVLAIVVTSIFEAMMLGIFASNTMLSYAILCNIPQFRKHTNSFASRRKSPLSQTREEKRL